MRFKKMLALMLTVALLISAALAGCGNAQDTSADAQGVSAVAEDVAASSDDTESQEVVETVSEDGVILSNDSSDFVLLSEVVPDAILEIRYYSTYNFVGDRIDGYEEPVALLTEEAAEALKEVSDDLEEDGYRLKIYDAYRPQ